MLELTIVIIGCRDEFLIFEGILREWTCWVFNCFHFDDVIALVLLEDKQILKFGGIWYLYFYRGILVILHAYFAWASSYYVNYPSKLFKCVKCADKLIQGEIQMKRWCSELFQCKRGPKAQHSILPPRRWHGHIEDARWWHGNGLSWTTWTTWIYSVYGPFRLGRAEFKCLIL